MNAANTSLAANPTANVVDQTATFLKRFVFLKEPSLYRLLALWIVHTYLIDEFDYTPYLFVHSPEKGCGKTCLLSVLDRLVFTSSGISASPTEAVLFRTATGHTQILDEVDTFLQRLEGFKGILNSGFQRNGRVQRMEKDAKENFKPKEYPVFAARVLAGIGSGILPEATRDRTFSIEMTRQTKAEKRERFRERIVKGDADALVKSIQSWVSTHKQHVADTYAVGAAAFPYLDKFQDRTIDISEPIAAVLEVAYADEPSIEILRAEFVHAISLVRNEQTEDSLGHRILGALAKDSRRDGELVGNASELALRCGKSGVPCSEYEVSRVLQQYGFETKSVRIGADVRKRYVLPEEALCETSDRYLSSNQADETETEIAVVTTR